MTIAILFFCIVIYCAKSQFEISCGETKTGYRDDGEFIAYRFISDGSYDGVDLNGCNADYDTVLDIYDADNNFLVENDDSRAQCGRRAATHSFISIPSDQSVQPGDTYYFVVSGYQDNDVGDYSIELICSKSGTPITPPPITPPPGAPPTEQGQATPSPTLPDTNPDCPRHREAWHMLTQSERDLYINGFKELSEQGIMAVFTDTHADPDINKHNNAVFMPWHRYMIWELETAFRNLGGEYACFGLPYWDWSYDIAVYEYDVASYNILNSGLSGDGDPRNGNCVTGNFGPNEYSPSRGGCLRREVCTNDCNGIATASQLMNFITTDSFYGGDSVDGAYRSDIEEGPHGNAHVNIGGSGTGQLGDILISPEDPIFFLLHGMVDYQYSLWQDCWDHELTAWQDVQRGDDYNGRIYSLDDQLEYGAIGRADWSYYNNVLAPNGGLPLRMMHSIEDWGYSYDTGDFFGNGNVLSNNICSGNINNNWFKDITSRRRRRLVDGYAPTKKSEYGEYSDDVFSKLHSRVGGKGKTKTQNGELYKTWAQMDCQYLSMQNSCERPKYFDDCSDYEIPDVGYGNDGSNDINITLSELIEKVSDYPCMVETRNKFYQWAKDGGNLLGLCKGSYDNFCDKDFRKEKGGDKCLAKLNKKRQKDNSINNKKSYDVTQKAYK